MINKRLLNTANAVFPLTLTFAHVLISCTCDSSCFRFVWCSHQYEHVPPIWTALLFRSLESLEDCAISLSAFYRHDVRQIPNLHLIRVNTRVTDTHSKGVTAIFQRVADFCVDSWKCGLCNFLIVGSDRFRRDLCISQRDWVITQLSSLSLDSIGQALFAHYCQLLSAFGRVSTSRCLCIWGWIATTFRVLTFFYIGSSL